MEIKVVRQIMEWNEDVSRSVRETLSQNKICMINVMGSPGSGKTSLILRLIEHLQKDFRIGVIEGDIAGQIDAETMESRGIPCVQLQTQGACHIEAMSIEHILPMFDLKELDLIFVENIGNLVCPAEFDIGEDHRIAVLSVPEGDDKPEKYPLMFSTSGTIVIHKYDMKPHFEFDDERIKNAVSEINPQGKIFKVSSRTQEGMEELVNLVKETASAKL